MWNSGVVAKIVAAASLFAVVAQAALRTEFPAAQRELWDTLAPWAVWVGSALAVLVIVMPDRHAAVGERVRRAALHGGVAAFLGDIIAALIDAATVGITIREAPLSDRVLPMLLAALIVAVIFALVCAVVAASMELLKRRARSVA